MIQILQNMGTDMYSVAATLIIHGCKGVPKTWDRDPVSTYLRKITGNRTVEATEIGIHWSVDGQPSWETCSTPPAVRSFIQAFDGGGFTYLHECAPKPSCFLCAAGMHDESEAGA